MMLSHLHYAVTILSLSTLALQQEETCESPQANATGIISFPGLTPPGVAPNTWYLSTSFTDIRHTNNNSVEQEQNFFTSFPASQNLSDPSNGIDGCVIIYGRDGSDNDGDSDAEGDWSKTCENVLEGDCQTSVLDRAQVMARSMVGQGVSPDSRCGDLMRVFSTDECEDDAEKIGTVGSTPLPRNTTCMGSLVGGSSIPADYQTSGLIGFGAGPDAIDEYEVYDQYIEQATPILFVAWGTAEGSTYTDARLMCITPNMIVERSRSDAIHARGVVKRSCVAVALFAVLFVF